MLQKGSQPSFRILKRFCRPCSCWQKWPTRHNSLTCEFEISRRFGPWSWCSDDQHCALDYTPKWLVSSTFSTVPLLPGLMCVLEKCRYVDFHITRYQDNINSVHPWANCSISERELLIPVATLIVIRSPCHDSYSSSFWRPNAFHDGTWDSTSPNLTLEFSSLCLSPDFSVLVNDQNWQCWARICNSPGLYDVRWIQSWEDCKLSAQTKWYATIHWPRFCATTGSSPVLLLLSKECLVLLSSNQMTVAAGKHREIHDVEQISRRFPTPPLITCEITFCRHVSELFFLVSTYLIWILGPKLILSNNLSSANLWVLDACVIVGLLPLMIILITASLSSKMYNWDSPREECAFAVT